MYRIYTIILFLMVFNRASGSGARAPELVMINFMDTVVFDLSQAVCSSGEMEFPVFILSDEPVYALDFSLKFNPTNLSYITAINLKPYLTTSAWYNSSDSTLRFSSNSLQPIDNNSPLVRLRFSLPSAQINLTSFDSVYTLLNGDNCSKKFINPILPINIGITGPPVIVPGDSLQLSVYTIPGVNYLWSTGESTPDIYVNAPGIYSVTAASVAGCNSVSSIEIFLQSPLPVQLVLFESELMENGIQLRWVTASETNNDYFEILKLDNDGKDSLLGRIDGAGNSNNYQHYNYLDRNPKTGLNFYQIRQIDFDGSYSYSSVINGYYKEKIKPMEVIVFPNPAKAGTDINFKVYGVANFPNGSIIVSDENGKDVLYDEIGFQNAAGGNNPGEFKLSNKLPAGKYIITIISEKLKPHCRFILY